MKTAVIANLLTVIVAASPAFAGETKNSALSALLGSAGRQAVSEMVPPVPAPGAAAVNKAPAFQAWVTEVKKVYRKYLESGDLFTLPEAKRSELPASALAQLKKDLADQHSWSPPYVATAYKLVVKGQKAFVIQNEKDGHSMTAHIFDAVGRLIAIGHADEATPLYWEKLDAACSAPSNSGSGSGGSGYSYPGYNHGSGPDAIDDGSGHGPAGGGPDDTSWDGCGSPGMGSGSDPDGSGGGVNF